MEKTVKFFKQDNKWYADIPDHTLDENEMVMGSDIMLEMFANGGANLTITLSDDDMSDTFITLRRKEHDEDGAWYTVFGTDFEDVWICNVTHDVFGEHPETIYINKINGDVVEWQTHLS